MLHDLANDGGFAALNGQLRTERYGDRQKGCQNLLYSRRLLMMMMMMMMQRWRPCACNRSLAFVMGYPSGSDTRDGEYLYEV